MRWDPLEELLCEGPDDVGRNARDGEKEAGQGVRAREVGGMAEGDRMVLSGACQGSSMASSYEQRGWRDRSNEPKYGSPFACNAGPAGVQ